MLTKTALRKQFSKEWRKHYDLELFKEIGFKRQLCPTCNKHFWTKVKRKTCEDSACLGEFTFIGNSPAEKKLDYAQTWKKFAKTFKKLGYTEISRYPVVARWRNDTWFTEASIYCFQPYVVSGEVQPPANPLVIPQPSLRFNDIENVGITGEHYALHTHIGQHAFVKPEDFTPSEYLRHIYIWLTEGLKIPPEKFVFREDVWLGGGNFGPCIEYFSCGCELGNQVYMQFKETRDGSEKLKINVLDMGAGLERMSWITQGTPTSYEIVFKSLIKKYSKKINLKYNKKVLEKFAKYGGQLNLDEVKDLSKAWKDISKRVGVSVSSLQKTILPLQAFYSILDHSRALLFALSDGALPSNSGGGHNLRLILRRALRFNEQFGWNLNLFEIIKDHAKSLKKIYPKIGKNLKDIKKILEVEEQKYKKTQAKSKQILKNLKKKITEKELIDMYDTQGILPEDVKAVDSKIKIPDDFYSKVAQKHIQKKRDWASKQEIAEVSPTESLYFADEKASEFTAGVLKVIDKHFVVLDKTLFYPLSGGQDGDLGRINDCNVVSVEKWGRHIVHEVEDCDLRAGETAIGQVDMNRRLSLMKNHTAVHIINGSARKILGNHIWQAGSDVKIDSARLDMTHFTLPSKEEISKIETLANKTVKRGLKVSKSFMQRNKAEKKFGFRLYQGGAVPGNEIRVVNIKGFDVEACGGTHVNNTKEIGLIKILGVKKIQDGVVRLEFVAGESAKERVKHEKNICEDCLAIIGAKNKDADIEAAAEVFSVPPDQLPKTLKRFTDEIKVQCAELGIKEDVHCKEACRLGKKDLKSSCEYIFKTWKKQRKELKKK